MENTTGCAKSSEEVMQAQSSLWEHIFNHIDSMSLKCAVELGIPDAVHAHGKPITLSELCSVLSIPPTKADHFRRFMNMLTNTGIFARSTQDQEDAYSLTPLSSILVTSEGDTDQSALVLTWLHPIYTNPFQSMSKWFRGGDEVTPLALHYKCDRLWDITARDPNFNKLFNEAMEHDTKYLAPVLLKDCRHMFQGINSLVDVAGGTGQMAKAISEAFPNMKCSVLDLPQVVNAANKDGTVDFIAGNMFEHIPEADAVMIKWTLINWYDEDCVKILKLAKQAISSKKDGPGKVIIIDQVMGHNNPDGIETSKAKLYLDMLMLAILGGLQRSEKEWNKIFVEAGFKNYKITPALGARSVIELFP